MVPLRKASHDVSLLNPRPLVECLCAGLCCRSPAPRHPLPQPSILELEYINGTTCELTQRPRSTTLQFSCGPENKLESIVEDYTCHYKVTIQTPYLCKHSAFVERAPPTRPVVCLEKESAA